MSKEIHCQLLPGAFVLPVAKFTVVRLTLGEKEILQREHFYLKCLGLIQIPFFFCKDSLTFVEYNQLL